MNATEIKPATQLNEECLLKARNLHVNFKVSDGFVYAVRGVSFSINRGQIVGIVGESGSGKSASTKSIIGFNGDAKTKADSLVLCGVDLLKIKKREWKYIRGNYVGYIPQDPLLSLNPTKKIGKQVFEAIEIAEKHKYRSERLQIKAQATDPLERKHALRELKKKYRLESNHRVIKKKVLEILSFIEIENPAKKYHSFPHEFSGGMRQRIAIAIAIASHPKLIIADEPTTALDVTVQAKVLDLIKKLRDIYNIAVIFISHNISLVANFCDYIYVMYAGKIVEQGTVKDVLLDPRHPYTWALIGAIPEDTEQSETLEYIPGSPPNLLVPPIGDAFAPRNKYALKKDFEEEPPLFEISKTHKAATWLLHEYAPKIPVPENTMKKIRIAARSLEKGEQLVAQTKSDTSPESAPFKHSETLKNE